MKTRLRNNILLFLCFLITACLAMPVKAYAAGSGSKEDPIIITTKQELKDFSSRVNAGETGLCARLDNNIIWNDASFTLIEDTGLVKVVFQSATAYLGTGIKGDSSGSNETFDTNASEAGAWYKNTDSATSETSRPDTMNGIESWTPIGTFENGRVYGGVFDGNQHFISGLYVNDSELVIGYSGLIGIASNTEIKNVNIVNGFMKGDSRTGGIVGSTDGDILNCTSSVIVIGKNNVGGIAGSSGGDIFSCQNNGYVTGTSCVGGICGNKEGNGKKLKAARIWEQFSPEKMIVKIPLPGESVVTVTEVL